MKFATYNIGNIMTGHRGLSNSQKTRFYYLQDKKSGNVLHKTTGKPLQVTAKEDDELKKLLKIKDASYLEQMSETAKNTVIERFAKVKYGYKKTISTKAIKKGLAVEQDIIDLILINYPEFGWLTISENHKENEYIVGQCDIITKVKTPFYSDEKKLIIDIKSSENFHTFMKTPKDVISDIYYGQLQGYMWLYEAELAAIATGLVNTPEELVNDEIKRLVWSMGGYDNIGNGLLDEFEQRSKEIIDQNTFDKIPPKDRLKMVFIERDNDYIKELEYRLKHGAVPFFNSLNLDNEKYIMYKPNKWQI